MFDTSESSQGDVNKIYIGNFKNLILSDYQLYKAVGKSGMCAFNGLVGNEYGGTVRNIRGL